MSIINCISFGRQKGDIASSESVMQCGQIGHIFGNKPDSKMDQRRERQSQLGDDCITLGKTGGRPSGSWWIYAILR